MRCVLHVVDAATPPRHATRRSHATPSSEATYTDADYTTWGQTRLEHKYEMGVTDNCPANDLEDIFPAAAASEFVESVRELCTRRQSRVQPSAREDAQPRTYDPQEASLLPGEVMLIFDASSPKLLDAKLLPAARVDLQPGARCMRAQCGSPEAATAAAGRISAAMRAAAHALAVAARGSAGSAAGGSGGGEPDDAAFDAAVTKAATSELLRCSVSVKRAAGVLRAAGRAVVSLALTRALCACLQTGFPIYAANLNDFNERMVEAGKTMPELVPYSAESRVLIGANEVRVPAQFGVCALPVAYDARLPLAGRGHRRRGGGGGPWCAASGPLLGRQGGGDCAHQRHFEALPHG
jgi:hypothetical protein